MCVCVCVCFVSLNCGEKQEQHSNKEFAICLLFSLFFGNWDERSGNMIMMVNSPIILHFHAMVRSKKMMESGFLFFHEQWKSVF